MQELVSMELTKEDAMRGKYMCFKIYEGEFAIEISYVTEIIEVQDITSVPNTEPYLKGITNLRGTIVPVIDMRLRFGYEEIEYTSRTCIIVLNMDGSDHIGIIVDEVQEVIEIDEGSIQPPPVTKEESAKGAFVKALGLAGDGVKQIIDINNIFEVEN